MFNQVEVSELHVRTSSKAIAYRVASMLITLISVMLLGGTFEQGVAQMFVAGFIGMIHYYLYDRLWLYISWRRDATGDDAKVRSITKAIIYRITVFFVVAITARILWANTFMSFVLATIKFFTNIIVYFVLERIYNKIHWGKYSTKA